MRLSSNRGLSETFSILICFATLAELRNLCIIITNLSYVDTLDLANVAASTCTQTDKENKDIEHGPSLLGVEILWHSIPGCMDGWKQSGVR